MQEQAVGLWCGHQPAQRGGQGPLHGVQPALKEWPSWPAESSRLGPVPALLCSFCMKSKSFSKGTAVFFRDNLLREKHL